MDDLIKRVLTERKLDALDRTKCSVSAKNVYNYLVGDEAVAWNDNLLGGGDGTSKKPGGGLDELAAELRAGESNDNKAYYVHFDHLCGETSHYFILLQRGTMTTLLQSAVFEFSIRDWVRPDAARLELLLDDSRREADRAAKACTELLLEETPERAEAIAAQWGSWTVRQLAVLGRVDGCAFSRGRAHNDTATVLVDRILRRLEGVWTEADAEDRIAAYAEAFSCALDPAVVRMIARDGACGGAKAASFRYVSAPTVK